MRRKDREVIDIEEILRIVDNAKILHLGISDTGYPYVVPLHYGYEYTGSRFSFFMHSAKEGHKLELIRANPAVCVELDCDVELVSGGEAPCMYGSTYASFIGRGCAEIVRDEREKRKGLSLLMRNQTGRDFGISDQMASAVEVIKVVISEFSAKSRPKKQ